MIHYVVIGIGIDGFVTHWITGNRRLVAVWVIPMATELLEVVIVLVIIYLSILCVPRDQFV